MKVLVVRRVRSAIALAGCGVLAVAISGLAQETGQPTFRTGVELVQVAVVVTDKSGQALTNLSPEDFALTEEGHPQRIVAFERIDVPNRDAGKAPLAAPSDVATNAGAADARLFVLLLDDLHIDPQHTPRIRRLARQFVEQFTSDTDLVMVIPTGGDTDLVRDFTTDRARVLETIDRFNGLRPAPGMRSGLEQSHLARSALDVLRQLAAHLASADRRVAVVFVTEGFPLAALGTGATTEITYAANRTVAAMQNSNCVLYLIDPRGLSIEKTDVLDDLQGLALDTGGFAAIAVNRFDETFDRIARENSSYYVLGFYPVPGGRPGQARDIEVKVPGRDVRVHSRRAFVVPKPPPEADDIGELTPDLARVLRSPVPVSDLPMRIQAVPFRDGGQTRVLVVLEIRGDKVDLASSQRIEIATTTIDSRGRASNGTMTPIALSLSDEEQQRARLTGFRWMTTLPLRSGTHQLRVAAQLVGAATRRAGLVQLDVEVPRIRRDRLELSGMRVSSMVAPLYVTRRTKSSAVPAGPLPTAVRQFVAGDTLLINVDAYPPQRSRANLEFTATLEDSSGTAAWSNTRSIEPGPNGAAAEFQVPTRGLTAGGYVLRVAGAVTGSRDRVGRAAPIEIVAAAP